jgi:hypothetical protein
MKNKPENESEGLIDRRKRSFMLRIQTAGVDKKTDFPKYGKSRQVNVPNRKLPANFCPSWATNEWHVYT